ncbi:hypothetical protein [Profundibacter sp.]
MTKNPSHPLLKEAGIFIAINVGASLLLRTGQWFWPKLFFTITVFLITIGTMLACNIYRAVVNKSVRFAYILIAVLNILTTVLIGNSGFLTSLKTIYWLQNSLIEIFLHGYG